MCCYAHRMRRLLRPLALVTLLGALSGCYGKFFLTRTLYKWNGEVTDNRFVHTIVFWAFVIIPVYELLALGDAIIFNVIEFWTGSNPLASGDLPEPPKVSAMADGSTVFATSAHRYRLYPKGERGMQIWVDDMLAGYMEKTELGGLALHDHRSGETYTLDVMQLDKLQAALQR